MAPNPNPMPAPSVRISAQINGAIRCSNGTEVTINPTTVVLHRPGPNGGPGQKIELPIAEWDTIHAGVEAVREALLAVNAAIELPKTVSAPRLAQ